MNIPYVSLTLTRRYVTELIRSPRAAAALGTNQGKRPGSTVPKAASTPAPTIGTVSTSDLQTAQVAGQYR